VLGVRRRSSRPLLPAVAVICALAAPRSARAADSSDDWTWSVPLGLRLSSAHLSLAGQTLSGTGADAQGNVRTASASASQLGIADSTTTFGDLFLGYERHQEYGGRWYTLGFVGFGEEPDAFRAGGEIGAGFDAGDLYGTAGLVLGGFEVSKALPGLGACTLRGCDGVGRDWVPIFEPKLTLGVSLPGNLSLEGFAGDDLPLSPHDYELGISIAYAVARPR